MTRALVALAALLLSIALARDGLDALVARTVLPPTVGEVSREVVDRNGRLIGVQPVEDGILRLATTPADVDPAFLGMLIAAEDKRFRRHHGVDPVALVRAALQAVWNGQIVSGGSTLTMQVARLIENSGTGGWRGKLRQMRVALALERRLSKAEILTLYLTHAPYGGNIEGVRAASRAWFGKPPARLAPEESALLVALPQSPTARRPDRHPDAATRARDRILLSQGFPGPHRPVPRVMSPFPSVAPHLADRALSIEAAAPVVSLTIAAETQTAIERLAARAVAGLPEQTSAAILIADHQTGAVQAYVGAANYGDAEGQGFVDMVRATRSPGSTLKPLIYALAFDQGLAHPETIMPDQPTAFGSYSPQNFDGAFRGDITARRALELSLNIPPVLLVDAMGPARLMDGLSRAGTDPKLPGGAPGLAVALGGVGLTLEDLVTLYAGLARGGTAQPLHWIGARKEPDGARIVAPSAAWQVGHILAGIQPPAGQPRGQIAFKTGTSYGHRDAWAIGWDGRHVVGVWLGRPDGTPVPGVFGGDVAAPILFESFDRLKPSLDPLPPPPPETLIQPTALLPKPLRDFRTRRLQQDDSLKLAFPPDGARLRRMAGAGLPLKLTGGVPPFAVVANGRPLVTGLRARSLELPPMEAGFTTLGVIDATGRSDKVQIRLD